MSTQQADLIEEFIAQVDTHGPDAVNFYYDTGDEMQPIILNDVTFVDGEIRVSVKWAS